MVNAALFPAPVDFVPYVALFPAWVPAPVPWSSSVASRGCYLRTTEFENLAYQPFEKVGEERNRREQQQELFQTF